MVILSRIMWDNNYYQGNRFSPSVRSTAIMTAIHSGVQHFTSLK